MLCFYFFIFTWHIFISNVNIISFFNFLSSERFLQYSKIKYKNSFCFFRRAPWSFFITVIWVLLLLLIQRWWLYFSMSYARLLFFCFLLSGLSFICCCFCTASASDLRECFYPKAFFTLHSFPTFGACTTTTYFSRLLWSNQLNLKITRASGYSLKYISAPTVCLKHTTIHKFKIQKQALFKFEK